MVRNTGLNIHPQAIVDYDECEIGEGTTIRQFSSVTGGTVLGRNCNVWPNVVLHGPVFSDRCIVASGVVMGPGFLIGNDCFIGPNVVLCNDMWPSTRKEGFDYDLLKSNWAIIIGNRVAIGANATVLPGVKISDDSVVAAGAVVNRDVPSKYLWRSDNELIPLSGDRKRMRFAK